MGYSAKTGETGAGVKEGKLGLPLVNWFYLFPQGFKVSNVLPWMAYNPSVDGLAWEQWKEGGVW